jgi:hypothetical protein
LILPILTEGYLKNGLYYVQQPPAYNPALREYLATSIFTITFFKFPRILFGARSSRVVITFSVYYKPSRSCDLSKFNHLFDKAYKVAFFDHITLAKVRFQLSPFHHPLMMVIPR